MDEKQNNDEQLITENKEVKSFQLQKPQGNLIIQIVNAFLILCIIGLVFMFIPLSMTLGYSKSILIVIIGYGLWISLIIGLIYLVKYLKKHSKN